MQEKGFLLTRKNENFSIKKGNKYILKYLLPFFLQKSYVLSKI